MTNPFVRFGLDPRSTLAQITERLRELAEDASDEERAALRVAWESLSRSPARRFELVLEAGPTVPPLMRPSARREPLVPWPSPTLRDVLAREPLVAMLPSETPEEAGMRDADLSFLIDSTELDVTGPLGPKKAR